MPYCALNPQQKLDWITNQATTVVIPANNSYLTSYPCLINGISSLTPLNPDKLVLAGSAIFSWMPTQAKFDITNIKNALTIVQQLQHQAPTLNDIESLAAVFQTIRGNSVVAVSKLLHFIYPDSYPIWDSRVAASYGYTPRNAAPSTKYLHFKNEVDNLKNQASVQTDCNTLRQRIQNAGYNNAKLTNTRLIELCFFL